MACLGGGHGLYQTLLAAQEMNAKQISAIVTVADDGGSSGRLRREMDIIPPGDLRMALAALSQSSDETGLSASVLQHRFGGTGGLAGHAVGNLLIAGLAEATGSMQAALDKVGELSQAQGRVIPVVNEPLEIEAEVSGLDEDPMVMRTVRGQVAVATTPGNVNRVKIAPALPPANSLALEALAQADLITLGPGSWFTSVIPHLVIPDVVAAISKANALRVVVLNLSAEPGETQGFSSERHIHMLYQHAPGLEVDYIVVDNYLRFSAGERSHLCRAAEVLGAEVKFADVSKRKEDGTTLGVHDPAKLGQVLTSLYDRQD
ncbi:uridine diphosphate-N-acetylglucosamine-binding protein YvcK [Corynebacterium phocae]|nr:uridine diphosphate-N-acetylglucosamine-binding protein YvcK [Corynebacterium phocae]